jgi:molecular chaperone DnaK
MSAVVGIDLGTTNSEVAIIRNGKPEIISVEGEPIMPSCVGIDPNGDMLVGRTAKNQMAAAPEATILSIKRKMGENIRVPIGDKALSPEEVSALILTKLKSAAEAHLGEAVTEAVITVPAYFDDAQRKATRSAGTLAGLDIRRIINEPTAAALAYDDDLGTDQTVLVYDIGGGTFDASLVVVQNAVVEVKASHGDTHLGGDDFDRLLMEYADDYFFEQHGIRLKTDLKANNRLWAAVEKAKRELSDAPYARIREEFIVNDLHLDLEIARSDYEEMIRPLLNKTMDSVHRCFKDAAMLPGAVDKVILVGGASRTPLVSELVTHTIGVEPQHAIDPDLIVAIGAAIQAGVINGQKTHSILVDITPYTYGTSVVGMFDGQMREDTFVPLIRRGTALPTKKAEAFATMYDGQKVVDVRIYQGEAPLVEDNIFIGNFLVENLSDRPAGNQVVLSLALDLDGLLEVTAMEKRTGLTKTVKMETDHSKTPMDLNTARENIASVLGHDSAAIEVSCQTSDTKQTLIKAAKDLRKRAGALMDSIDPTDAQELRSLLAESQKAVADGETDTLTQLNESLSDMLFYLED